MVFVYVSTHVSEFPINTILAWIINNYHEQGNIIITNLLLPLGHISNSVPPPEASYVGCGLETAINKHLLHLHPLKNLCPTLPKLPRGLEATIGDIDHEYPEDGKT